MTVSGPVGSVPGQPAEAPAEMYAQAAIDFRDQRDAAELALGRIRDLCFRDGYTTWDGQKHLPDDEAPFSPDDPRVVAWEAAHGHDFRLKCYAEYGCQLLLDPEDVLAILGACDD